MNIGIILAAGASERFRSTVHKQYLKLNGKEVIYYSINGMNEAKCFDKIIAVVDANEYESGYIANKYGITCISGGETRNKSVKNALKFIKDNGWTDSKVVFHDCSRPFVKSAVFGAYVKLLDEYDAVATTEEITDSLVANSGKFVNRRDFSLVQTPEAFRFDAICDSFDENSSATAIANQVSPTATVLFKKSNAFNFKITYPEDLFLAEQLMRIDFLHGSAIKNASCKIEGKVLLLGGSGGVGCAVKSKLEETGVEYYAPGHKELDLLNVTAEKIAEACPFGPDVIINVAAAYESDDAGLLESFGKIFDVNLRSNLVLIEYAKTLKKRVNIVVMSSSSSTRGRENLTNYSAAKAALNSIVESQGRILSESGIYINAVIPEKINTPLIGKLHKTQINTRELLDAEEVVNAVMQCAVTIEYGKLIHIRKGL
ncbi:MAG: SDR family oxidoreductase [Christensenellales bacterium]